MTGPLLTPDECRAIAALYPQDEPFRSRVVMARHGFGRGEYKYFAYPLPDLMPRLRDGALSAARARREPLARGAGRRPRGIPATHATFLARCHAAGQVRPTPLLLRYGAGDYNCLHQDLYGEHVFPLQVALLLSEPGRDFTGGEFVLTEQRPRMQSRVEVVPLRQGDGVIFAVHHRPVAGHARHLPRQPPPRRQPPARRHALHDRRDLSRRGVTSERRRSTLRQRCALRFPRSSFAREKSGFRMPSPAIPSGFLSASRKETRWTPRIAIGIAEPHPPEPFAQSPQPAPVQLGPRRLDAPCDGGNRASPARAAAPPLRPLGASRTYLMKVMEKLTPKN